MTGKETIGTRLREWGIVKFGSEHGWINELADSLGIHQSALSNYLSDKRRPGNKMQSRLRELGCDIEWLMTGEKGEEKHHAYTSEEEAMLKRLRELGIDTKEKFDQYLSPENLAADMAMVLRKRMTKFVTKRRKN